jgi:hypothetical protein
VTVSHPKGKISDSALRKGGMTASATTLFHLHFGNFESQRSGCGVDRCAEKSVQSQPKAKHFVSSIDFSLEGAS